MIGHIVTPVILDAHLVAESLDLPNTWLSTQPSVFVGQINPTVQF